jgi:hypothetical protein
MPVTTKRLNGDSFVKVANVSLWRNALVDFQQFTDAVKTIGMFWAVKEALSAADDRGADDHLELVDKTGPYRLRGSARVLE